MRNSRWFMIVGVTVLVLVLATVGYLVWQNRSLASQIGDLREKSTSTIASPPTSTTSTSADPWQGKRIAYTYAVRDFLASRKQIIEQFQANPSGFAVYVEGWHQLSFKLETFPLAPPEIQRLQDAYYVVLRRAYALGSRTGQNPDARAQFDACMDDEYAACSEWALSLQRLVPESVPALAPYF